MTFFQFRCKLTGWREAEESKSRATYEAARLVIDGVWRTAAWKNNKVPNVYDAYRLPWDPKPETAKEETEIEKVERWYQFKKRNPGINYNKDKEALIKKHIDYLSAKFE